MIFFSIIIPTYNNLKFLKKTIASVEKQEFRNFEIIVIDDGSTDGTLLFLKNYKKKINLKFFTIKRFGGPAKPRNIGIKKAKGEWLCFLDSDDLWFPKKLLYVSNFIKKFKKKYQVYHHNELLISKNKKKKINYKIYKGNYYYNLLLYGNNLSPSAVTINRNFIKKYNIFFTEKKKFISVEDYDFWLKSALCGAEFKYINKTLGVYNIHKKNLTSNIIDHKKRYLSLVYSYIFKNNLNFFQKKKLWAKIYLTYKIELEIIKFLNFNKVLAIVGLLKIIIKRPISLLYYLKKKIK